MADIKVRVAGREMTLEEARQGMDPNILQRLQAQHPQAGQNQQAAQAFVDAYSQEHHRAHGQPFGGEQQSGGEQPR
jgi:hypothetical protein